MGSPSDVVDAALAAARVAYQLIDMAKHKGKRTLSPIRFRHLLIKLPVSFRSVKVSL